MLDLQLQITPQPDTPVNHDFAPVAYYFDVALWSSRYFPAAGRWIEAVAGVKFGHVLGAVGLVLTLLLPCLWLWPADGKQKHAARARRTAGFAVAAMGFTELGLEILLLLGFQALYGYLYHELTVLVALFMVGMALGAWWGFRSAPEAGRTSRWDLRLLAGLQLILAVTPLLVVGLFIQLGRVGSMEGQSAASEILFPTLALVAGWLGGFQFLLASRAYFAERRLPSGLGGSSAARPYAGEHLAEAHEATRSPGVLYALDLAGSCAGALALSVLLIPLYGFLRTAMLMAAANLAPALMAYLTTEWGNP
jgi:hypothetical protein